MSKNKKIVIFSLVFVAAAIILGVAGFILIDNFAPSPTMLSKEIEQDNLKHFITETVTPYIEDNTVTVKSGGKSVSLPLTDFVTVDVEKTEELIINTLTNKGFLNFSKNELMPVFKFDRKNLENSVLSFIKENDIAAFATADEGLKTVSVDFTKDVPDVKKTCDLIIERISATDLTSNEILFSKNTDSDYLYNMINKDPVDAMIVTEGNDYKVIKEKYGYIIDKEQLINALNSEENSAEIEIIEVLKPEVTEKYLLDKKMFGDVLASCTSYYNTNQVGRSKNVALAASKINGYVMQPGDIFSYNGVVGPRTYANGFKDAGVYTANGLEDGVGGGICQVSSTLYGAQLMADLKTVSRTNHSYTISYLPTGQDATVSYGTIDYKFQNNMNTPIKIQCIANGGVLTISILGIKTDSHRDIKIYNEVVSSTPPKTIEREADDLAFGEQRVKQAGQNGVVVNTYKIYYKDGVKEKTDFVHKSTYIPMPRIVEVGKPPVEETPEENPLPFEEENPTIPGKDDAETNEIESAQPENDTPKVENIQNSTENQLEIGENEEIMIN